MLERFRYSLAAALILVAVVAVMPGAQTPATYKAPRTHDGKPNLNGYWQAIGTAHWDLQAHEAKQGPIQYGAMFSTPGGVSYVDGDEIPYLPAARKKKDENYAKRLTDDPEIKCFFPGVPRATYLPYPFQITQTPTNILIAYEFAGARRMIPVGKKVEEPPVEAWMGTPFGRWQGETFVVETIGFNDQTWFDRAGNHHSEALKVTERYTATSANTLLYEATIEDPKIFSRPWKISMPLYRRLDKNMQLIEYKCPEFAEELMYGQYKKK